MYAGLVAFSLGLGFSTDSFTRIALACLLGYVLVSGRLLSLLACGDAGVVCQDSSGVGVGRACDPSDPWKLRTAACELSSRLVQRIPLSWCIDGLDMLCDALLRVFGVSSFFVSHVPASGSHSRLNEVAEKGCVDVVAATLPAAFPLFLAVCVGLIAASFQIECCRCLLA